MTAIRVIIFINAGFTLLIGLVLAGLGLGVLLSEDFAREMDMEDAGRTAMFIFGAAILLLGGLATWLGVRAGRPGQGIMRFLVVFHSFLALINLATCSLVALGLAITVVVLAVSGTGRAFYDGRWGPWYQS